jgi:hypothetical protein
LIEKLMPPPEGIETVSLTGMTSKKHKPDAVNVEIATTIFARDYKGLSNFGTNGVIECRRKQE